MALCPCGAQQERSQVLADNPYKRRCITCDKVWETDNPEHKKAEEAAANQRAVVQSINEPAKEEVR